MDRYAERPALSARPTQGGGATEGPNALLLQTGEGAPSLHAILRAATQDVHDRLHRHAGFAAVQDGTIGLSDYRNLIARLYGFYVPFETEAATGSDRSRWLARDLETLGIERPAQAVPTCRTVPSLGSAHLRLGACYVVEGSALGGRGLARGLDRLLGQGVKRGRQFFIGRGPETGEAWRSTLAQLSAVPPEPSAQAEIIGGAVQTFAAFEHWLNGWRTLADG